MGSQLRAVLLRNGQEEQTKNESGSINEMKTRALAEAGETVCDAVNGLECRHEERGKGEEREMHRLCRQRQDLAQAGPRGIRPRVCERLFVLFHLYAGANGGDYRPSSQAGPQTAPNEMLRS